MRLVYLDDSTEHRDLVAQAVAHYNAHFTAADDVTRLDFAFLTLPGSDDPQSDPLYLSDNGQRVWPPFEESSPFIELSDKHVLNAEDVDRYAGADDTHFVIDIHFGHRRETYGLAVATYLHRVQGVPKFRILLLTRLKESADPFATRTGVLAWRDVYDKADLRQVDRVERLATRILGHLASAGLQEPSVDGPRSPSLDTRIKVLRKTGAFNDVSFASPAMVKLFEILLRVSDTRAAVLLEGETGSGKGEIAKIIHRLSRRKEKPLVHLKCNEFAPTLIEAELFGVVKGAFTGATKDRKGRILSAEGGTLFADEIQNLTTDLQQKLLGALSERCVRRVGSDKEEHSDFRLIAATNVDIDALVATGEFHEDLFYRLHAVRLAVPPLRARREELRELVRFHLNRDPDAIERKTPEPDDRTYRLLETYHWPGNVRQLFATLDAVVAMSDPGRFEAKYLPPAIHQLAATSSPSLAPSGSEIYSPRASSKHPEELRLLQSATRFRRSDKSNFQSFRSAFKELLARLDDQEVAAAVCRGVWAVLDGHVRQDSKLIEDRWALDVLELIGPVDGRCAASWLPAGLDTKKWNGLCSERERRTASCLKSFATPVDNGPSYLARFRQWMENLPQDPTWTSRSGTSTKTNSSTS